jgi:uncharacterized protein
MLIRMFRSLMPKDGSFIERFSEHSCYVVSGAEAFHAMLSGAGTYEENFTRLSDFEEKADVVTRETIRAIHRTFVTPFDRSQILDLITALDDTIDLMKDAGRRFRLYGLAFTPEMRDMAGCAVRATQQLRDAMPLLSSIDSNVAQLNAISVKVGAIESEADDLLEQGLASLFQGEGSPGYKLTMEQIYDRIEAVVDRCEDVTDVIDGIVIEQV